MTAPASRRMLPIAAWPAIDRRLWERAQGGEYVATLNSAVVLEIAAGYGRWIAVLSSLERLDEHADPAERITSSAVQAYIDELSRLGNKRCTIVARLGQLAAAMRIMTPGRSFIWLHPSKLLGDRPPARQTNSEEHQLRGWPAGDRRLWRAGNEVGDILAGPRYAARLRPDTIGAIITGYRRWLVFLRAQGWLDPDSSPATRVTRENVVAYVQDLRGRNGNASLVARLSQLRSALQIMEPEADFRWLTSPGGRALSSLFPILQTPIRVFDSKVLYEWGRTMMNDALADPHPEKRRIHYRNGLLIALLAARAPRVRSMASLRLGQTVISSRKTYKLLFEKEDVKTGRQIEYHAPIGLSAAITRYIEVERAELLAGQSHDWFWVNKYGAPLGADEIGDMIQRQSKRSFGEAFGPHKFRHALGTTAPLADPAHPGVAAAVLGISGRMVDQHYNRANQAAVAKRFHASVLKDRARLQSIAGREFRNADIR